MGILNVTPDSFADGGRYVERERALAHAGQMRDDGADLIDIGGESSRPGASPVTESEELDRVLPLVEALAVAGYPLAVDTRKPAVMRAAAAAGAAMINDIGALTAPGAVEACAQSGVGVCLMHMQREPQTMQAAPDYRDVVAEVRAFLEARAQACLAAGIARECIAIDPGFGFGKTLAHNLELLRSLGAFAATGFPVVAGLSRKSSLGAITGRERRRADARECRCRAGCGRARRGHRPRARRARDGRRAAGVARGRGQGGMGADPAALSVMGRRPPDRSIRCYLPEHDTTILRH